MRDRLIGFTACPLAVWAPSGPGAFWALAAFAGTLAVRAIAAPTACSAFVPFVVFHAILLFSSPTKSYCFVALELVTALSALV